MDMVDRTSGCTVGNVLQKSPQEPLRGVHSRTKYSPFPAMMPRITGPERTPEYIGRVAHGWLRSNSWTDLDRFRPAAFLCRGRPRRQPPVALSDSGEHLWQGRRGGPS
ncbi:hypothetical protein H4V95_000291 [Arthrobacter sp. CAN_C5]|nr:hypothetical protein [Arthrobacter sp. CAN_C5]